MKPIYFLALIPTLSYACIIDDIINHTYNCSIEFGEGTVIPGLENKEEPNVIPPRKPGSKKPLQVNIKGIFGTGDYLPFKVVQRDPLSVICREYRIYVDEKKQEVSLQRKDVCGEGYGFETISEPVHINPDDCIIDLVLTHGPDSMRMVTHTREIAQFEHVDLPAGPTDSSQRKVVTGR